MIKAVMMLELTRRLIRRRDVVLTRKLMLLAGLAMVTLPAGAQAQVLRIVDPPQWRESRPYTMASRAPLRIAGFVSQPGGISRVLVNGVPASMEPDPNFPDSYNFERIVPADSLNAEITITIEPRTGETWSRTYTLELTTRPVDSGQAQRGQAQGAAAPPPRNPPATQIAGPNPWGGFKKRGILYGLVAVGGIVAAQLEKSSTSEVCEPVGGGIDCFDRTETSPAYQGVGFAAAGAAVAALVIDAVLTSGKSRSSAGSGGGDNGLQLERPSLSGSATGVRLDLLRLRFQ